MMRSKYSAASSLSFRPFARSAAASCTRRVRMILVGLQRTIKIFVVAHAVVADMVEIAANPSRRQIAGGGDHFIDDLVGQRATHVDRRLGQVVPIHFGKLDGELNVLLSP